MTRNSQPEMSAEMTGEAIRAFRSARCPACDGVKLSRTDPFCLNCLDLLTPELHEAVHDKSRFIESYHPALERIRQNSKSSKAEA